MPLSRSDQARVNGAKSCGPKTPDGKARSSLNALKHGRYATNAIILSNEDANALEELVARYVCRIQPSDPVEYSLTRELASIDWRLTRVFALDTRMLDREMDIQLPALVTAGQSLSELTRLLDASRSIADRSKLPAYLARREAQLLNARRSILAVLKDLRKSFPSSDPATEVVLPQPLDPESPLPNEPETNPTGRADPQVCAGPLGPAPNSSAAFGADSEDAPQVCAPEPTGPASEDDALGPAPEQTSPQPANVLSIDGGVELSIISIVESGNHAPNLTPDKSLPGAASYEAALDTKPASVPQPAAAPIGSAPVDLSGGSHGGASADPGGRPTHAFVGL